MAFVIDDGWDNCGPVARAGNTAFGTYCRCGAWVARNIFNGAITEPVVPTEVAVAYGSPEISRKLVDVGLWEAVDGGWLLVHYLDRNDSAEKVAKRRKNDAERKARYRENIRSGGTRTATRESVRSPGGTTRRTPRLPTPLKGEGARGSAGAPTAHMPSCPYQTRDPATCSVCASERKSTPLQEAS